MTALVHQRSDRAPRHHDQTARTLLAISGSLVSLAGAMIAVGGYLSPLRGSSFHMLVGLGLIGSGVLVAKAARAGAWICLSVFAATLSWSLGHAQNGSSLSHRLVGPGALLAVLALLMPVLCNWRPRQAVIAFAIIMVATVSLGLASDGGGPLAAPTAALSQFLDAQTKGVLQ